MAEIIAAIFLTSYNIDVVQSINFAKGGLLTSFFCKVHRSRSLRRSATLPTLAQHPADRGSQSR